MGPGWRQRPRTFAPQASVMAAGVRDDVGHEYTCFMRGGEDIRLHGRFHRIGPNLAKADFSATESQRRKKYSQNQCVMPTDTCTDPVGSRKVRPVHRERSLEHTGCVNRCKSWCIKAKCVVTWER